MFPVLQDSAETLSVKVGNYTFSCLLSEKSYIVKNLAKYGSTSIIFGQEN